MKNIPVKERYHIFLLLMFSGGIMGAYSYVMKGGVFANAQTANCLLLGLSAAKGNWNYFVTLLFPITTYFMGSVLSEIMERLLKNQWEIIEIILAVILLAIVGILPSTCPFVCSHILITLVSAMQYNTFKKSYGSAMSTVFCTAHIRQAGVNLANSIMDNDKLVFLRFLAHLIMVLIFIFGAFMTALLCKKFQEYTIFFAVFIQIIVLTEFIGSHIKQKSNPV